MNKIVYLLIIFLFMLQTASAADIYSKEYLQGKNHFSLTKPLVENIVKQAVKSTLKKETGANFDVKFSGYTTSSIKKGIFKSLEISGKNVRNSDIVIPYVHLKSVSDYNYIDYTKSPIVFKSDMEFAYDMELTEETINSVLEDEQYQKVTDKVNKKAFPIFMITGLRTKIIDNRVYFIMKYNFPLAKARKDREFVASSELQIVNGEIKAKNVKLDSVYGNMPLDKVANLINLLNPLEFALDVMDSKNCTGKVENVNIVDNKVIVDGRIFIKGEK